MFFKKFINKFFTKEYNNFQLSQLEFRKQTLRLFQVTLNIFLIIEIVILFTKMKSNINYYITVPTLLILNNLFIWFLNRMKKVKWYPRYFFIFQLLIQGVGLELAISTSEKVSSDHSLLMGVQIGLLHMIGSLNLSSVILKFASSIIFCGQILFRLVLPEVDNTYLSLILVILILIVINVIYYRHDMLNLSIWNSYTKSNIGLLHFQKLIDIFPSQIVVINKISFNEDKALYLNQEAELLKTKMLREKNIGFKTFLDSFLVGEKSIENSLEHEYSKQKITLKSFIQDQFARDNPVGEFQKMRAELNNFHWEIEYGWIEWNKEDALILIFNDISKSEKITELETLDKNKDKVLATVSHELRTPLNAVVGMIDISLEEIPENCENVQKYLKVAKESAKVLSMMINNILDMELIRKGKLQIDIKPCFLSEILENVVPLGRVLASKKNLEFVLRNNCPINTMINVDPFRFQQILMNLLDNAVKFTSEGFVKLTIKIENEPAHREVDQIIRKSSIQNFLCFNNTLLEKEMLLNTCYSEDVSDYDKDYINENVEDKCIKISVEDSGIGISEQKKSCLFKLFGKEQTNLTVRGMGLGLAISQSLALKMGSPGIRLKSDVRRGSKFFFTIKTTETESFINEIPDEEKKSVNLKGFSNKKISDASPSIFKEHKKQSFKILVVDDDEVNHLVISLYLKAYSHIITIDKAYNGREAIEFVRKSTENKTHYDLILMDCDMPVMSGLEATKALKKLVGCGEIPDLTIIALTANASIDNKECCIDHGMVDVWNKPIPKSEFLNKLRELVPKSLKDRFII